MALSLGFLEPPVARFFMNALSERLVSHATNVNPAGNAKKCLESDKDTGHIRAIGIGPRAACGPRERKP
jgi:hypothetical protein